MPVCLPACMFVSLSTCRSVCLPTYLPACPPACLSLSFCLSLCLSACLYVCLPACLPVCLTACLSVCHSLTHSLARLSACVSWSLILDRFVVLSISVRTGLQRFKPLDQNAPALGRTMPDNTSLSSLSVGGVPRQKFLLITIMDKDVSLIFFQKLLFFFGVTKTVIA